MAPMVCGQMDTLYQRSAQMKQSLNVILKNKEKKILGKQLRCLNDAIQRIASRNPVASAQDSSLFTLNCNSDVYSPIHEYFF